MNKQIEGSRRKAWAIHACFRAWSLGGNQSSDKHRMVPPFYFLIMKRIYVLSIFMAALLFFPCCTEKSMRDIKNMADGFTEENIKAEFEPAARRNLPQRISDDVVLKDVSYDNHVVTLYYVFDEEGGSYNLQKIAEEIKKRRLRDKKKDAAFELYERVEISERIVVKGNGSGNVAETYITLREMEDAVRFN